MMSEVAAPCDCEILQILKSMGTWPPTAKLCFAIGHAEAGPDRQPGRDCAAYPAGLPGAGAGDWAVYSQADEEALPVQLATQAVCWPCPGF